MTSSLMTRSSQTTRKSSPMRRTKWGLSRMSFSDEELSDEDDQTGIFEDELSDELSEELSEEDDGQMVGEKDELSDELSEELSEEDEAQGVGEKDELVR